ncbi:MAG: CinA family protein [Gammaproteobacteria bacterium]|nr:CinA family protein [Gammaproteobacteria bacterium]
MSIEQTLNQLATICLAQHKKIATAESCTGGMVAQLITDCAGSSQWFDRGFVTYSNLSKEQMLKVDKALIEQWGAVSEQVAEAMAQGVLYHSSADYSLAITGIAGPGGGTDSKPVGTVCFAWAYYDSANKNIKCLSETQFFTGNRQFVRIQSAYYSLKILSKIIT